MSDKQNIDKVYGSIKESYESASSAHSILMKLDSFLVDNEVSTNILLANTSGTLYDCLKLSYKEGFQGRFSKMFKTFIDEEKVNLRKHILEVLDPTKVSKSLAESRCECFQSSYDYYDSFKNFLEGMEFENIEQSFKTLDASGWKELGRLFIKIVKAESPLLNLDNFEPGTGLPEDFDITELS